MASDRCVLQFLRLSVTQSEPIWQSNAAIRVDCLTYDSSDEFRSGLIYADKERVVHDHLLSEELGVVMNRTGENRFRMRSEKYRTFTDH